MSAVQSFVYGLLSADAAVTALVGTAIYDTSPTGVLPDISVLIGAEEVIDASDKSASARLHRIEIEVVARTSGFALAKDVAQAVKSALQGASGPAGSGQVTRVQFKRSAAFRETDEGTRRVRLRFDIFYDGL